MPAFTILQNSGVRRKKFRGGGFKVMAGLVGGTGGGAPRTPENFRKFAKKFLKKIAKIHYFSKFFKRFNKPCVKFLRVWMKNTSFWNF